MKTLKYFLLALAFAPAMAIAGSHCEGHACDEDHGHGCESKCECEEHDCSDHKEDCGCEHKHEKEVKGRFTKKNTPNKANKFLSQKAPLSRANPEK